ncbi:hypothetical protein DFH09DRAFT_9646 [Mycena vulgaris]|nr:hypothetical protein DFH09DRAFT_9646 [Mycena vulgaris]
MPPRIVYPESLALDAGERVWWIFRGWLLLRDLKPLPVPVRAEDWTPTAEEWDNDNYYYATLSRMRAWQFLSPFFLNRGYAFYEAMLNPETSLPNRMLLPPNAPLPTATNFTEPDAGYYSRPTGGAEFGFASWRAWAARDIRGRDVVIKLVSWGPTPSPELEVLAKFNMEPIRSDVRNHITRVLEFLSFGPLTFAAMPRWDGGWNHSFRTVREVVHFIKDILEALDFMHEHRVVHRDLGPHNIGMNWVTDDSTPYAAVANMRHPSVARYTIFDFGIALIYPPGTALDAVKVSGTGFFFNHLVENRELTPRNPFKFEVACLGSSIQGHLRQASIIIPALGPFFDKMTAHVEEERYTARQALEAIAVICGTLSDSQLDHILTTDMWRRDGHCRVKGIYTWIPPDDPKHGWSSPT